MSLINQQTNEQNYHFCTICGECVFSTDWFHNKKHPQVNVGSIFVDEADITPYFSGYIAPIY